MRVEGQAVYGINCPSSGRIPNNGGVFMDQSDSFTVSRVPWSSEPSLKEMADEVGVNVDRLIDGIEKDKTDSEMAQEFDVPEKLVYHLRDHFYTHGLDSVMGQD